jgi:cysteinyl-tRNA synthetase
MALRWFLVSTQYRQAINYTVRALEEASDRVFYLYQTLCDARDVLSDQSIGESNLSSGIAEQIMHEVYNALSDDLNTPLVLASFSPHLKTLNDLIHTKKGRKRVDRISVIGSTTLALEESLRLLGLLPKEDIRALLQELKTLALKRAGVSLDDVYKAIEDRAAARAAKEYETADEIRKAFEEKGIFIMDTPTGTSWRPGARPEN